MEDTVVQLIMSPSPLSFIALLFQGSLRSVLNCFRVRFLRRNEFETALDTKPSIDIWDSYCHCLSQCLHFIQCISIETSDGLGLVTERLSFYSK